MELGDLEYPFTPSAILSNIEGVTSWHQAKDNKNMLSWFPPPSNTWKSNVDGSSKSTLGPKDISGVLQNECYEVLLCFCWYV